MFQLLYALLGLPHSRPAACLQLKRYRPVIEPLGERCLPCAGLSLGPAPSLAALVSDSDHGHDQPFHLSGVGAFTPISPTDATFTASGTSTSLGHWTNYGELHFDGSH